jgi:PAS domain S-box-containing protein
MAARSPTETKTAPQGVLAASPSVTTALKHAPMGIAIFDDQMRYLAASRQYLTDQGMSPDTPLLGLPPLRRLPRDPAVLARQARPGAGRRASSCARTRATAMSTATGGVHWVRWSMAPWRTDDGRIGGLVLYTEMVTQAVEAKHRLQAAEARYRAVFDQAAMGVARVSGSGRFLEVNDRFCAIIRRDRPTLLAAKFMDIVRDPDAMATVMTQGQALLAGEIDSYTVERRMTGRDDGVAWIHLTASRVDPGDGRPYLVVIISDITARKQVEAEQQHYQGQLRLLINELNHRVKNTLATVQSMASQTLKTEPDPLTAFDKFESRLMGLSQVHDVLTRESWHGAGLSDVAERALTPFTPPDGEGRLVIDGPPVWLAPGGALTMALIFHELATNALKYGALSNGDGRVVLGWTYDAATRDLALTWTETGGPPVAPPTRRGFGSRLIERSLRGELKGAATMDWRPEGLVCTMRATLSDPVEAMSPPGA